MGVPEIVKDARVILDIMIKMKLENPRTYSRIIKVVVGIAASGIAYGGYLYKERWDYASTNMMDVLAKNGLKEQIDEVKMKLNCYGIKN